MDQGEQNVEQQRTRDGWDLPPDWPEDRCPTCWGEHDTHRPWCTPEVRADHARRQES